MLPSSGNIAPCSSCVNRRFGKTQLNVAIYWDIPCVNRRSSETSSHTRNTRSSIPEDDNMDSYYRCENFKSSPLNADCVWSIVTNCTYCCFQGRVVGEGGHSVYYRPADNKTSPISLNIILGMSKRLILRSDTDIIIF